MSKGSWIKDPRTGLRKSQLDQLDDRYFTDSGSLDYSELGDFEVYGGNIAKAAGYPDPYYFLNNVLDTAVDSGFIHIEMLELDTLSSKKLRIPATQIGSAQAGGRYIREFHSQRQSKRATQV